MDRRPAGEPDVAMRRFAMVGAAVLVAFAVFAIRTPSAAAADVRTGSSPSVGKGEKVSGDLYLFGGDVQIAGTVAGDAVVSSGRLNVSGPGLVGGSLSILAGDAEIDGTVDGSVRIAGGNVTIRGHVGRDVVAAGGRVTIEGTAAVGGDLIVAGGDVSVLGPVKGDVRGNMASLTIDAQIGRDVRVRADDIRLRSRARVAGNLLYTSRNVAQLDAGATVAGTKRQTVPARFNPGDNLASWFASAIFRLLCALFAGVVLVLLLPRATAVVADGIRGSPASSFVLGLVLLVLTPVFVLILLVTVIGIPIALILLTAYLCVLYLSQVFLGLAIGRIVLPDSWDTAGRGYNLLAMTIGVVLLAGLRLIPVPFVGAAVATVTAVFGLGAVVLGPRRWRARSQTAFPRY